MQIPENLKYTSSHEWIADNGDGTVTVGITAVATEQLGDLVYVELPKAGTRVERGGSCAVVESTKAASDVYAPVSGTVTEGNQAVVDEPSLVNSDPEGEGWFFKLSLSDNHELSELMNADQYKAYCDEQG